MEDPEIRPFYNTDKIIINNKENYVVKIMLSKKNAFLSFTVQPGIYQYNVNVRGKHNNLVIAYPDDSYYLSSTNFNNKYENSIKLKTPENITIFVFQKFKQNPKVFNHNAYECVELGFVKYNSR